MPGDTLLLDDSLISVQVVAVEDAVVTRVLIGGVLGDQKGLNRLWGGLSAGALTVKDRDDIRMAELGVDYWPCPSCAWATTPRGARVAAMPPAAADRRQD